LWPAPITATSQEAVTAPRSLSKVEGSWSSYPKGERKRMNLCTVRVQMGIGESDHRAGRSGAIRLLSDQGKLRLLRDEANPVGIAKTCELANGI
jgi:hypothetical protein